MTDEAIYIERHKSGNMKVQTLQGEYRYRPCDAIKDDGIYISEYDYSFEINNGSIFAYVEEVCTPKYWDHEYISPLLYIGSLEEAVIKHDEVDEITENDFTPEMIKIAYLIKNKNFSGNDTIEEVIKWFDQVIDEIRKDAKAISKRNLLKYINS